VKRTLNELTNLDIIIEEEFPWELFHHLPEKDKKIFTEQIKKMVIRALRTYVKKLSQEDLVKL